MPGTYQLIYRSKFNSSRIDKPLEVLRDILRSSNANNIASGVTGYLLFDGETFLQILEGEEASVRATFDRIEKDARHTKTEILQVADLPARQFERWTMGGYFRDERDLEIFRSHGVGSCRLAEVPAGAALLLTKALAAHRKTIAL